MNRFRRAAKIFLCVLREIFDESSYARFLKIRNLPSSPAPMRRSGASAKPRMPASQDAAD